MEQHIIDTKQYMEHHSSDLGRVRTVPRLCEVYPGVCLKTREKARKNLCHSIRKDNRNNIVYCGMLNNHQTQHLFRRYDVL
jgi:hypothetical protein